MCRSVRKFSVLSVATLPSTVILYLWAVLVWQWHNRLCLNEMFLKRQRRSKVPPNARCLPYGTLFRNVTHRRLVMSYRRFGITYCSKFFRLLDSFRCNWWASCINPRWVISRTAKISFTPRLKDYHKYEYSLKRKYQYLFNFCKL
jgi:hypothetical protein